MQKQRSDGCVSQAPIRTVVRIGAVVGLGSAIAGLYDYALKPFFGQDNNAIYQKMPLMTSRNLAMNSIKPSIERNNGRGN